MRVAGADVWDGQWVVVVLQDGAFETAMVAPTIADAVRGLDGARTIGVDMPIGLPPPGGRRVCDGLARTFVGARRNSVFWTPCAELLEAPSYAAARARAAAKGWPGISAQAYALKQQILAVRHVTECDARLVEVHPEVSFAQVKGSPLHWSKTSWNGTNERRALLAAAGIEVPSRLDQLGAAGIPDVLDAAIVAWSAHRVASGRAGSLPPGTRTSPAIWF